MFALDRSVPKPDHERILFGEGFGALPRLHNPENRWDPCRIKQLQVGGERCHSAYSAAGTPMLGRGQRRSPAAAQENP